MGSGFPDIIVIFLLDNEEPMLHNLLFYFILKEEEAFGKKCFNF